MNSTSHPFPWDSPLLLLNTAPKRWFAQVEHPGDFIAQPRTMNPGDIAAVLDGRCWIATYAPSDGIVDRLEFDLDCKTPDVERDRDHRYWAIRDLMGRQRLPLVVRTPSKGGLHVSYRIPPIELTRLVTGLTTGVVADILRDAGLAVGRGSVEIFPQVRQCKRLPIGRSMAILDPDTLEPMVEAPERPRLDSPGWGEFAEAIAAWHGRPHEDLAEELIARAADIVQRPTASARTRPMGAVRLPSEPVRSAAQQLIERGLPGPSTRYTAEFSVGAAIWKDPARFAEFGACVPPTRENVAYTLARWLSTRHNGVSQEWLADVRTHAVDETVKRWARRYLRADSRTGRAPVDRMLQAAFGESTDCGLVSAEDMAAIRAVADELFGPGLQRYALEVWTCSLLRATKTVAGHHRAVGGRGTPSGNGWVEVEILADWMERWPWGGGRTGEERVRTYTFFRDKLVSKGWLVPVSPPVRPVDGLEQPGQATRYRVRTPLPVRERELPVPPDVVAMRIAETMVNGRPLSIEEAYHALDAVQCVRRLERRYGSATSARIRRYAETVSPRRTAT